jgi:hypothetical protein
MERSTKSKNAATTAKKKSKSINSKSSRKKRTSTIRTDGDDKNNGRKKAVAKKSKTIGSSDVDADVFRYKSNVSENTKPTPNPSGQIHDLPDPDEMLASLTKGMRPLKLEAKRLFDELENIKKGNDQAAKEILEVKRKVQLEKLKGNELIKVDHLLRLGFDEVVLKEHLEATNKDFREEIKRKQKDVNNLGTNVQKMLAMNKECEKAVTAAHGAYGPLVVKQQTLQAKLEQAEVELYAIQTKVEHRRNMKSVEIASKDKFKTTMKDIVRKLQIRCRDQELLHDVLRKAGKSLETDLSLSPVERAALKRKKDSETTFVASPKTFSTPHGIQGEEDSDDSSDNDASTEPEQDGNDSESISVSSSDSSDGSSVEVSSVES